MKAMKAHHRAPSDTLRTPPRIPHLLLHTLALALVGCILAGGALYLYTAFNKEVSTYRRDMNASAYDAQFFFDRREAQLRSVTAAMLPARKASPPVISAPRNGTTQLEVVPVTEPSDGAPFWYLLVTARDRQLLDLQQVNILHTSTVTGLTRYVTGTEHYIPSGVQAWIAEFLSTRSSAARPDGYAPLFWLRPPGDDISRLFLYTPLDTSDPGAGWVGLEVNDIEAAIRWRDNSRHPQNYVLLTPLQHIVLHEGEILDPEWYSHKEIPQDSFFYAWDNGLPSHLVLSKAIGEGGWRLVYSVPISVIFERGHIPLYPVLATVLMLCLLVALIMHQIRRRLLQPALVQYAALQDSERLTRTIVDAAPVGLCLIDRNSGVPLVSNEQARQWMNAEDSQWRLQALQNQEPGQERTLRDGRSILLKVVPMMHQGHEVALCAMNDITALKEVERSLLTAKHKADSANKAKTDFIATMSHEIRTPLFGIMGTLELLSLTELTQRQRQYLRTIQLSSGTLMRTISETLDLARAEAGHEKLQISDLSPVDLLNSVVASYADRARAKGILLYGVADCRVPQRVAGDELRLRQILNNLVSNAIKFTLGGHVVLRLRILEMDDSQVTLCFQVADTGIGIPPEHQHKLFAPYYQVENRTQGSDNPAGSGLGLFICKRLASLMHGTLSVVSTPGLGTSIDLRVSLPLGTQPASQFLQPRTVYVSGAIQETVLNLCDWLNLWGINALPFQPGDEAHAKNALLLSAWPLTTPAPDWQGQRLVMSPPGQIPDDATSPLMHYCNAYDLQDLKRTLLLLQEHQPQQSLSPTRPFEASLGLRVMVADDNMVNQRILSEQLAHLGCTVLLAKDGQSALQQLEHEEVDVVLTDINMPIMDGYTLASRLRSQHYKAPIYGVTASAMSDERKRARDCGMEDLLLRPLSINTLHDTLQAAIVRGRA